MLIKTEFSELLLYQLSYLPATVFTIYGHWRGFEPLTGSLVLIIYFIRPEIKEKEKKSMWVNQKIDVALPTELLFH